jgi:hypothetical protein
MAGTANCNRGEQSMIQKSAQRFSEKIMLKQKDSRLAEVSSHSNGAEPATFVSSRVRDQ